MEKTSMQKQMQFIDSLSIQLEIPIEKICIPTKFFRADWSQDWPEADRKTASACRWEYKQISK